MIFGRKPQATYLPARPSYNTWLDLYSTHLAYMPVDKAICATDEVFDHIANRQITVVKMDLPENS